MQDWARCSAESVGRELPFFWRPRLESFLPLHGQTVGAIGRWPNWTKACPSRGSLIARTQRCYPPVEGRKAHKKETDPNPNSPFCSFCVLPAALPSMGNSKPGNHIKRHMYQTLPWFLPGERRFQQRQWPRTLRCTRCTKHFALLGLV